MKNANLDVKEKAKKSDVKLWQVSEELGISDGNFSRKLRRELSKEEKERIFAIIDELRLKSE